MQIQLTFQTDTRGFAAIIKCAINTHSLLNAIFSLEDPQFETLMQYAFRTHARAQIDKLKKKFKRYT